MFPKRLFAVVICLLLVALAVTPALAAKEYQAESFDVLVEVQSDGTILVTETITFHFEGGPFTYVFREIPRRGTDVLEVVAVTRDGLTLEPGTEPGQAEIDNGDPLKVTWHFGPVSDATHEFGLTYRVVRLSSTVPVQIPSFSVLNVQSPTYLRG